VLADPVGTVNAVVSDPAGTVTGVVGGVTQVVGDLPVVGSLLDGLLGQ